MDDKQIETEAVLQENSGADTTVVSIFKNLTIERFKEKPKIVPTSFEEIQRQNEEIRRKTEEKRKKDNKNVLRSYRIK